MNNVMEYLKIISEKTNIVFSEKGKKIRIRWNALSDARSQAVEIRAEKRYIILTSTVVPGRLVNKKRLAKKELLWTVLLKNKFSRIVNYSMNSKHDVEARISLPENSLDFGEFEFYLSTLVHESDRFQRHLVKDELN